MKPRWEVVARMHGTWDLSWIIPASSGRHFRYTRFGAWWTARRWTRRHQNSMTWEFRRLV